MYRIVFEDLEKKKFLNFSYFSIRHVKKRKKKKNDNNIARSELMGVVKYGDFKVCIVEIKEKLILLKFKCGEKYLFASFDKKGFVRIQKDEKIYRLWFDYTRLLGYLARKKDKKKVEYKKRYVIQKLLLKLKIKKFPFVKVRNLKGEFFLIPFFEALMLGTKSYIKYFGKVYCCKYLFIQQKYLKQRVRRNKEFKIICGKILRYCKIDDLIRNGCIFIKYLKLDEKFILNLKKGSNVVLKKINLRCKERPIIKRRLPKRQIGEVWIINGKRV